MEGESGRRSVISGWGSAPWCDRRLKELARAPHPSPWGEAAVGSRLLIHLGIPFPLLGLFLCLVVALVAGHGFVVCLLQVRGPIPHDVRLFLVFGFRHGGPVTSIRRRGRPGLGVGFLGGGAAAGRPGYYRNRSLPPRSGLAGRRCGQLWGLALCRPSNSALALPTGAPSGFPPAPGIACGLAAG